MAEMAIRCGDCGKEIHHSCAPPSDRNSAQLGAISPNGHEIAHGVEVPEVSQGKTYNKGYDLDFLKFWKIYPQKKDKRKAQMAWRNAVRRLTQSGANRSEAMAVINAGAERYRDDPNRDESYTKWAEGWLNGDRWEDEALPLRGQARLLSVGPDPPRPYDPVLAEIEIERALQEGRERG